MKKIISIAIALCLMCTSVLTFMSFATDGAEASPEPVEYEKEYMYDSTQSSSTGWWFHESIEGSIITVEFTAESDFLGFDYFRYASPTTAPLRAYITDEDEEVIWENNEFTATGDTSERVLFGQTISAGTYFLNFELTDTPDGTKHFVLGSADPNPDNEVYITSNGAKTNDVTKAAPYVALLKAPVDPNATPTPTPEVTPTPEPTPTPEATATVAPTATATATAAATTSAGSADSDSDEGGLGTPVIIGIIAAAVVVVAVVVVLVVKGKKK